MKNKYEILWILAWIVASLLMPKFSALAADKVVVIPLWRGGDKIPTVTSATGRIWMDRNLGAVRVAESKSDHGAYGWLYQWGRLTDMHQIRYSHTATNQSNGNVPGHGHFIILNNDWISSPNNTLWEGVSGVNNPCPVGFRLPTHGEWNTERGFWSSNDSAGAFASPLKLVVAGQRNNDDGVVLSKGEGCYWSSTASGTNGAIGVCFDNLNAYVYVNVRAGGMSVRCIKD